MDESNLDRRAYQTAKCKVCNDDGLDLNECGGKVIPNQDEVEDGVPYELRQVRIGLKPTWETHEPHGLLFKFF